MSLHTVEAQGPADTRGASETNHDDRHPMLSDVLRGRRPGAYPLERSNTFAQLFLTGLSSTSGVEPSGFSAFENSTSYSSAVARIAYSICHTLFASVPEGHIGQTLTQGNSTALV